MKYEYYELDKIEGGMQVPVPQSYRDCFCLICSDYYGVYREKSSLFKIWLISLRDHRIKYLFWMRMSAYRGLLFPLCKWRQEHFGK